MQKEMQGCDLQAYVNAASFCRATKGSGRVVIFIKAHLNFTVVDKINSLELNLYVILCLSKVCMLLLTAFSAD